MDIMFFMIFSQKNELKYVLFFRRQLPPTPASEEEDEVDGAPEVPERTCSRQGSVEQPDIGKSFITTLKL